MPDPTSVKELDLSPIPGKKYFTIDREWREEFIYFLIVDRFQDNIVRPTSGGAGRAAGINIPNTFFGGNIKGITRNLDYTVEGIGFLRARACWENASCVWNSAEAPVAGKPRSSRRRLSGDICAIERAP